MKSRRVILTIEVQTDLTIAEIRNADRIAIGTDSHMGAVWIYREPGPGAGRLVQVQANAIQPVRKADMLPSEQERRDARAKLAKKFGRRLARQLAMQEPEPK